MSGYGKSHLPTSSKNIKECYIRNRLRCCSQIDPHSSCFRKCLEDSTVNLQPCWPNAWQEPQIWDYPSDLVRTIPSKLKFGETWRFSNSNEDVMSFVKFDSSALLVDIFSLGSPRAIHRSANFLVNFVQRFPQVSHVFFQFSSEIGQSMISIASRSNTTDMGMNDPGLPWFARDGEGKWFKTDRIIGSRSGHWEDSICHSDKTNLRSLWMSLLAFSSVPLTQSEQAVLDGGWCSGFD